MFQVGDTALHKAASEGRNGLVDVLLKYNADPDKQNKVWIYTDQSFFPHLIINHAIYCLESRGI